jgi:hypothetical protein
MASEKERAAAEKRAAKEEAARFKEWKKMLTDKGYTVKGDSMEGAFVSGIPQGPTYSDKPGK